MHESDGGVLRRLALGHRVSQVLYVFAELGLADLMADKAVTAEGLAAETGSDPGHLRRILRVCRELDLVRELPEDAFELTSRGHLLSRDAEGSVRARMLAVGATGSPRDSSQFRRAPATTASTTSLTSQS